MPKNFAHLGGLSAYEILGVAPTATAAEIEAAYRAAIKRQHSDTGGVTRLAQLVNDAHDALVKNRAAYDAWLRDKSQPRVAEAEPDPGPAASTSGDQPDDVWDPWENAEPSPPPHEQSGPRNQHRATTDPSQTETASSPDEPPAAEQLSSRGVVAIVAGGMGLLVLVSLAIAIFLGVFSEPSTTSSSASPTVMKQGQVVVEPGTRVALDEEGASFKPSGDHASMVGTQAGLRFEPGTSYVAPAQPAPERYDTCSTLGYPEPTGKPIPWNRLTVGSMLCVRTTSLETTTSLITVVARTGRSATLRITTWND
jgi:hypothetical protein